MPPSQTRNEHASASKDGAGVEFSLDHVSKRYGDIAALDDISLAFAPGSTTALIGSSGSGKSTLLRTLIGLEWPDSGSVSVDGHPLAANGVLDLRRRVGYVIQDGGLFPHLTAIGNVALLPHHLGWTRRHCVERARELAELAHLPIAALDRFPAELSGGQRQRVALMRALMLDPHTLLLDEPLGALDPIVRYELQAELRRIFRELGKTVVLVTHDLSEAAFFANRLVVLKRGRIIQDGSFAELRDQPADRFVTEFLKAERLLPEGDA
ncbi:MAG: ATP-binding cassette domain-containing protein [Rhodanobacteraceae bacterium]